MKKVISLIAAVAVMGMGSAAMAQDYTLPTPQTTLSMTVTGYTTTPIVVADPVGGGIEGDFEMAAFSGTLAGEYQETGSGVSIEGGADLFIEGEDQVGCTTCDDNGGFLPDNTIAMSLVGGGAAGYGRDSDGNEVVFATNTNTAIVGGSMNVSGGAGIASGAAASNGFWTVETGDFDLP